MPLEMSLEYKEKEQKSYKKRKIVSIVTVLCILLCFAAFIPRFAHADMDDPVDEDTFVTADNVAECQVDFILDLTSGVFIKDIVEDFYASDVMENIINSVTGQTQSWMSGLTTALKAIGTLIVVYYMVVMLLKELQRGEMTMESWMRILITFIIPAVAIAEFDIIIEVLAKSGQWIYQVLNENITITTPPRDSAAGVPFPEWPGIFSIGDWLVGIVEWLVAFFRGLVLTLGYLIVNIIIIIMIMTGILTNYVEIILRHLFMPIALANISHEGVRSIGVRYIKKYFGCFMKIATIIVAVCAIFFVYNELLQIPNISGLEKILFFLLLVPGTKKSLQMTNEIISDAIGD